MWQVRSFFYCFFLTEITSVLVGELREKAHLNVPITFFVGVYIV